MTTKTMTYDDYLRLIGLLKLAADHCTSAIYRAQCHRAYRPAARRQRARLRCSVGRKLYPGAPAGAAQHCGADSAGGDDHP